MPMRGAAAIAHLAAAAILAVAAIIHYHDPNPTRPILLGIASICASAIAVTVSATRRQQR